MSKTIRRAAALLCLLPFGSASAVASSDDAWESFRADIAAKCEALAANLLVDTKIVVDPYGTETYGAAILTGKAIGTETMVTHLCVYNKKSQTAEIGSELAPDVIGVTIP